ncbi:MAG: PAS domain S-box protein [Planctomycetes bacterium]|nr:PAS domain S-box protein [Planctomycetota bacterium]
MIIRSDTSKTFHWIQWSSVAVTVVLTVFAIFICHRQFRVEREEVREYAQLKMTMAKEHIEEYLLNIGTILRFISVHDEVVAMTPDAHDYIEAIYTDTYEQHVLSEIYVIKRDFDGTHRPFMTFEHGDEEHTVEEIHDLESEKYEYETQVEQIRCFAQNPALEAQISSPGKLCVSKTGVVYSVPVRSQGELVGIVAGMIPEENISEILETVDCHEMVLMVNERGDSYVCDDMDEQTRAWFQTQLRAQGVKEFFNGHRELFEVGKYQVTVTEVDILDGQEWYLTFLHDEAAHLQANGFPGILSRYSTATMVFLLGITMSLLCRIWLYRVQQEKIRLEIKAQAAEKLQRLNNQLKKEITERKKTEKKLIQAAEEWKLTFDSISDLISIQSKDFKFLNVNKAFAEAFEMKPEEAVGKTCCELVHGTKEPWPACPHKMTLDTKKPERVEFFESHLGLYLEVSVSPIFSEDGEFVASVHIAKNITERKKVEEKQTKLLEKVENINRELNDFASIVSHDLKAPLRGIKTLANWILSDCADKLGDEANEQMNLLLERVELMYNLIEGVLQYSRVGKTEGKRVQVNINDFVPELIKMVVPPKNITVTIEDELPVLECEEIHIMQIFQNLLSNAIKYMDKPQGRIQVGCVEQDGFWKFSIADNGPGIEEKHFERIFKIFQALSTSPDFEGTGVGLTVVKKLVELYHGRIWLESKVGEGSTFFFTLPKQEIDVYKPIGR